MKFARPRSPMCALLVCMACSFHIGSADAEITKQDLINFLDSVLDQIVTAPFPPGISELITMAQNAPTLAVSGLEIYSGFKMRDLDLADCGASAARRRTNALRRQALQKIQSDLCRIKMQRRQDEKKAEEESWFSFSMRMGTTLPFPGSGNYSFYFLPHDSIPGPTAELVTPADNNHRQYSVPCSGSADIFFISTADPEVFELPSFWLFVDFASHEMYPGMSTGSNRNDIWASGATYDASTCLISGMAEGRITNDLDPPFSASHAVFFGSMSGSFDDSSGALDISSSGPVIMPLPPDRVPRNAPKMMGAHVLDFDAGLGQLRLLENSSLAPNADVAMVRYGDGTYLEYVSGVDDAIRAKVIVAPLSYLGTGAGGTHLFSDAVVTLEGEYGWPLLMSGVLTDPVLDPAAGHFRAGFQVTFDGGHSRVVTEIAGESGGFKEFQIASGPGAFDMVEATAGFTVSASSPWPEIFHLGVENPTSANLAESGPNDAFPAGGLDLGDLAANSVRFDMALNTGVRQVGAIVPGDSICVDILPGDPEGSLSALPEMHYRLRANPMFDPYRTSGLPALGYVEADSVHWGDGTVISHRWSFDLPDTGFIFPGDMLHFYFAVTETQGGGTPVTYTIPEDTTGYSTFIPPVFAPAYPEAYTMNALPSMQTAKSVVQPSILLWNDAGEEALLHSWRGVLNNLGYRLGMDYDVFTTRAAEKGASNGLGGRATLQDIVGYDTILYSSGLQAARTITEYDPVGDLGDDIGILNAWRALGNRNLLICGEHAVSGIVSAGGVESYIFLEDVCHVNFVSDDIRPLIWNQAQPQVAPVPGNPVFADTGNWFVKSGCYDCGSMDAIEVIGDAIRLAGFLIPDGTSSYSYAAGVGHEDVLLGNRTVLLPYDPSRIGTVTGDSKSPAPFPSRVRVVEDILNYFGHADPGPATNVPGAAGALKARAFPNPFNAQTTIRFELPRAGLTELGIYDLRGGLVRTLIAGYFPAGPTAAVWDGRDGEGRSVASGQYAFRLESGEEVVTGKLVIIK